MKQQDLLFLQSYQEYPSVSIFVTTHRKMPEREQDPIQVKNAIQEAKDRLLKEYSAHEVKDLFENLDKVAAEINYSQVLDGLAIFVNKHVKLFYHVPLQLENRVNIDKTFVTRDLIYALNRLPRYWVLSLGEKPTRLYAGYAEDLSEVIEPAQDLNGNDQDGFPFDYIPPNVASESDYMGDDRHQNKFNSSSNQQQGGGMYMKVGKDAKYFDAFKREFLLKVDELLARFLENNDLPLVLIGTESLVNHFEDASQFKDRVIGCKHGNYEDCTASHVAGHAWPIVKENLEKKVQDKLHKFEEDAIGANQHAIGLEGVWRVAQEGRVWTLFVEKDYSVGGVVNPENEYDLVVYDKSDAPKISDDLVNLLIELVMEKGGEVVFCEPGRLKEYGHIAAMLRY